MPRIWPTFAIAAVLFATAPVGADVVQSTPAGFEVRETATVDAPVERVWATLVAPRLWWNREHTYSDDSANLSLDERAGGCFCEKLPGRGSVEHLRVVYIQPPQALRMVGALGPLQAEAAQGTMAIVLARDGAGTKVTMTYLAGGYIRAGADKIAAKVDEVLAVQIAGLKAAVEGKAPPAAAPQIQPNPLADLEKSLTDLNAGEKPAQPPAAESKPRPAPTDSPR